MIGKELVWGLVPLGVLCFFALVQSRTRRSPRRDPASGDLEFRWPALVVYTMGGIGLIAPVALGVLCLFHPPPEVLIPIVMGGFFLLVGGSTCQYAARRSVRLGESGIRSRSFLSRPTLMAWREVAKVGARGRELWLRDGSGKVVELEAWFVGVH